MKHFICLVALSLFVGCASDRCHTFFRIDNGEDYLQDGMRRIVDRRGRIGYADEKGTTVIEPRFAFGFPFENGRAKVTNKGEKKAVPGSRGEYHYWESDKWYYIDKTGRPLPRFSVMERIPTQIADDKENRRYRIAFTGSARWYHLPYDHSDDRTLAKIRDAIENTSTIEVTLLDRDTIIDVQHSYKERPRRKGITEP